MVHIIVKNYEHLNRSFANWDTPHGVHVKSKDHYDRLMKEQNMTPYDPSKSDNKNDGKPYIPSKKALDIIASVKNGSNRGKVKLTGQQIEAMKSIGAIGKEIPSYMQLPKSYSKDIKGGFMKNNQVQPSKGHS